MSYMKVIVEIIKTKFLLLSMAFFWILLLTPLISIAKPVFKITPTFNPIYLKPNMEIIKPITFSVENVSGADLPNISFDIRHQPNPLFDARIVNGPDSCIYGSKFIKNTSCTLNVTLKSHGLLESSKLTVRVCAYGGFLCSRNLNSSIHVTQTPPALQLISIINPTLPADTEKDITYPVVFTFTNSNPTLPATGVSITKNQPNFTETSDTCGSQIAASSSCQIAGNFKTTVTGPASLSATLSYNEGTNVTTSTSTTVTDVDVIGTVSTPLPADTEKDITYPVVFTFTNSNPTLPATGVSITKNLPNFTETSDTCGSQIAASSSCQIAGNFKTTVTGPASLSATLSYNEGTNVTTSTSTTVTDVDVIGTVSIPLPADTEKDITYPVVFTFTNNNPTLPATGVSITKNQPNFTETSDTCGSQIAASSSCQIAGNFKTTVTGPASLSATLSYNEGTNVTTSTSTTVTDIDVIGTVNTPLPANTEKDITYPVVFTFTNNNPTLPATGVSITKNLPNFTETSDTCGSQIAASSSCQIAGNFKTTVKGPASLSATLSYNEGTNVTTSTSTTVTDVDVIGTVSTPLPANTEKDITYPVVFTFTNNNPTLPATGVSITKNQPNFTETSDTCGSQIAASSSCQIAGNFKITVTRLTTLSVTLSYNEGDLVILSTTTYVTPTIYQSQG